MLNSIFFLLFFLLLKVRLAHLVNTANQVDDNLACTVIINDFKFPNVP